MFTCDGDIESRKSRLEFLYIEVWRSRWNCSKLQVVLKILSFVPAVFASETMSMKRCITSDISNTVFRKVSSNRNGPGREILLDCIVPVDKCTQDNHRLINGRCMAITIRTKMSSSVGLFAFYREKN